MIEPTVTTARRSDRKFSSLPAELEARIQHLENPQNQGAGFTKTDWLWLWSLGVVAPILLLIWGWL